MILIPVTFFIIIWCFVIVWFCYNVLFLAIKCLLFCFLCFFFSFSYDCNSTNTYSHTYLKKKILGRTLLLAKFVVKFSIFIKQPLKKSWILHAKINWEFRQTIPERIANFATIAKKKKKIYNFHSVAKIVEKIFHDNFLFIKFGKVETGWKSQIMIYIKFSSNKTC